MGSAARRAQGMSIGSEGGVSVLNSSVRQHALDDDLPELDHRDGGSMGHVQSLHLPREHFVGGHCLDRVQSDAGGRDDPPLRNTSRGLPWPPCWTLQTAPPPTSARATANVMTMALAFILASPGSIWAC